MKIKATELAAKVLRVNMTTGTITEEVIDDKKLRAYVGGAALGGRILYEEVPAGVAPFDPENRFIVTTGVATGTTIPGTCMFNICTKGPITELAASAQGNGYFGLRLKESGFSTIIVEGQAASWQYLVIADGKAELRDASELVGMNTFETEQAVKETLGDKKASVLTIGLGGENLVRYGTVQSDMGHFASSNGPGSVMGSKKLKAIAAYGDYKIEAVRPDEMRDSIKTFVKAIMDSPPGKGLSQLGTGLLIPIAHKIGYLPIKNLSVYDFPEYVEYDAAKMKQNPDFEFKKNSCFACPIGHCRDMTIKTGRHAGMTVDEPEYEGWQAFSGLIGVTDIAETAMLNRLNDELGLDLKEMGYTLAWAIECFERGLLTLEDTDGLSLTWGNVEAIRTLMNKIATRDGFGAILAEGVMRASQQFSQEAQDCAVYCKRGSAPHIHDPRGNYSVAFAQMFSENGSIYGAANRAPNPENGFDGPVPYVESEAHPILLAKGTPRVAFFDSYMMCNFVGVDVPMMMDCFNHLTGWEMSIEEAMTVGSRMANVARAFNIRHGAKAEEDTLSKRLLDPVKDGPVAGASLGAVVEQAKVKYYRTMGWNETTSYPLVETLQGLGLEDVAEELYGE